MCAHFALIDFFKEFPEHVVMMMGSAMRWTSFSMVKQKFDPGSLIFGKVKGYTPWPARVTAITSKNRFDKKS